MTILFWSVIGLLALVVAAVFVVILLFTAPDRADNLEDW